MGGTKFNKEKIGLIVGLAAVFTNPASGAYINDLYNRGFDKQTQMGVGSVITVVAFGYFLGLTMWNMYKNRDLTKIPSKQAKIGSKTPKFIET